MTLAVTAGETAALIAAGALGVLVVGLLVALNSLVRTLAALRRTTEELRVNALPMVMEARQVVAQANADLERVDVLMGTAESIGTTMDSLSRLAYLAFSNPLVKGMAFFAGTAHAYRRVRRRD